jgi:hypothetical protein
MSYCTCICLYFRCYSKAFAKVQIQVENDAIFENGTILSLYKSALPPEVFYNKQKNIVVVTFWYLLFVNMTPQQYATI